MRHGLTPRFLRPALVAVAVTGALSTFASAQTIGVAALVHNSVTQARAGAPSPLDEGEEVFRNAVIRTAPDSSTKLVFADNTNLAVGPASSVTLDRFVFSGDNTAQKVTVNLVRGAFRFTTGSSDKKAYEIKTPVATIGVRGTEVDISSEGGRSIVRLNHGAVIVCTASGSQCTVLTHPGDTVIVTAGGISRTTPGGPGNFTFASFCSSDPGLCGATQFTSLPSGGASVAALCGR